MLISDRWFFFCEHKHWRTTRQHLGDEQGQIGSGGGPRARWTNPGGNGINLVPPYASARPGSDDDASSAAAAASSGFPLWQLGEACRPSR